MGEKNDDSISTTDAGLISWISSGGKKKDQDEASEKSTAPPYVMPTIDPDSDYYDMSHPKRGFAVIFNHYKFDDYTLGKRDGTSKDCKDLEKELKRLDFDVVIHHDLKYGAIRNTIEELSEADHTDADCLVMVVLTHGERGKLYARDHQYPPDELWMPFTGDRCPSLAGKPKLFFVQACRGDDVDEGATLLRSMVQHDAVGPLTYSIPVMADILVMYSTYDGFYSWRSPVSGSWFVQCLCAELEKNGRNHDLMTLLTFVNRRMAVSYKSNVPHKPSMHSKKQIGTITSTLTKIVLFQQDNSE